MNDTRKNYVRDTNILLHDPDCILNYREILPLVMLEDLNNLKTREGLTGCNTRQTVRMLSEPWRESKTEHCGRHQAILRYYPEGRNERAITPRPIRTSWLSEQNDSRILLTALRVKQRDEDVKTILVSKDICMRLKADAFGNIKQKIALALIMDVNVKFVSITGGAVSGKAILATG